MSTTTYTRIARDMAALSFKIFDDQIATYLKQSNASKCQRRKLEAHALIDKVRYEMSGLRRKVVIEEQLEELEFLLDQF